MKQAPETGILSNEKLIGKHFVFQAKIGFVTDQNILLRQVKEKDGRFFRDHIWIPKVPNILSFASKDGIVRFKGQLIRYESKAVSYKIAENRWMSLPGKKPLKKYNIVDITFLDQRATTIKPSENMLETLAKFKKLYSDAILVYENNLWIIKVNGMPHYAANQSIRGEEKCGNREYNVLSQLLGKSSLAEKIEAEALLPLSYPIQYSHHKAAQIISRFCFLNPSYQGFVAPDARLIVMRYEVCGNKSCTGSTCQDEKCGAKFIQMGNKPKSAHGEDYSSHETQDPGTPGAN